MSRDPILVRSGSSHPRVMPPPARAEASVPRGLPPRVRMEDRLPRPLPQPDLPEQFLPAVMDGPVPPPIALGDTASFPTQPSDMPALRHNPVWPRFTPANGVDSMPPWVLHPPVGPTAHLGAPPLMSFPGPDGSIMTIPAHPPFLHDEEVRPNFDPLLNYTPEEQHRRQRAYQTYMVALRPLLNDINELRDDFFREMGQAPLTRQPDTAMTLLRAINRELFGVDSAVLGFSSLRNRAQANASNATSTTPRTPSPTRVPAATNRVPVATNRAPRGSRQERAQSAPIIVRSQVDVPVDMATNRRNADAPSAAVPATPVPSNPAAVPATPVPSTPGFVSLSSLRMRRTASSHPTMTQNNRVASSAGPNTSSRFGPIITYLGPLGPLNRATPSSIATTDAPAATQTGHVASDQDRIADNDLTPTAARSVAASDGGQVGEALEALSRRFDELRDADEVFSTEVAASTAALSQVLERLLGLEERLQALEVSNGRNPVNESDSSDKTGEDGMDTDDSNDDSAVA